MWSCLKKPMAGDLALCPALASTHRMLGFILSKAKKKKRKKFSKYKKAKISHVQVAEHKIHPLHITSPSVCSGSLICWPAFPRLKSHLTCGFGSRILVQLPDPGRWFTHQASSICRQLSSRFMWNFNLVPLWERPLWWMPNSSFYQISAHIPSCLCPSQMTISKSTNKSPASHPVLFSNCDRKL